LAVGYAEVSSASRTTALEILRQSRTSHCVYKTPWHGDPRINIQNKNGKAKAYQVKQVLDAISKIEEINNG